MSITNCSERNAWQDMCLEVPPSELMPRQGRVPVPWAAQLPYLTPLPSPCGQRAEQHYLDVAASASGFSSAPESPTLGTALFGSPWPTVLLTGIPQRRGPIPNDPLQVPATTSDQSGNGPWGLGCFHI